jgi:hypothetical protein
MLLVQWHRGRKVIIVPESHDDSRSLDSPAGWRLIHAGFEALRLSRRDDSDDNESESGDPNVDKDEPNHH